MEIIAQATSTPAQNPNDVYNAVSAVWVMVCGGLAVFYFAWNVWLSKGNLSNNAKYNQLNIKVDTQTGQLTEINRKLDLFLKQELDELKEIAKRK